MNYHNQLFKFEMVFDEQKHKTDVVIKKRSNQWQNEVHKVITENPMIIPISYGDRFIPRRYSLHSMEKNLKFATKNVVKDVLNLDFRPSYWRHNSCAITLNSSFQLEELRILQLTDPAVKGLKRAQMSEVPSRQNRNSFDWPCKPRLKPLAFAEATHDSPGFDRIFDHSMIDWSVNGQIVASFGKDVIIWRRADDVTMLFNVKNVCSLAYSPNGKFLAIGCKTFEFPILELWDVSHPTTLFILDGKVFAVEHLAMQCIAWSHSANQIICGTGLGAILVLSVPGLNILRKVRRHKMPVTCIKLSPTLRYMASGDVGGNIVVYNWNSCEVYIVVESRRKLSTTFDWHPWNGVDLVISENVPASIVVLHVPSKEIVAYYQRRDRTIIINSITFSRITGELLVSMSKSGNAGDSIDLKIVVMSSLSRVVDLIRIPDSGARFVMWSPDGTKLATAGNDETLTIWNFLPENKQRSLKKVSQCNARNDCSLLEFAYANEFQCWSCIK